MIDCISVENMRRSDALTIENCVSGTELMYRAALGIYKAVQWKGKIAILVGSGNNGGDGFALACILKTHGIDAVVYKMKEQVSPDSAYYEKKACSLGIEVKMYEVQTGQLKGCGMIVDCLLGTGFRGEVRGIYRDAILEINGSGAYVVSADINSGLNGDDGSAELAVRSDLTVTIGYIKNGLLLGDAPEYIGRLICADIGIALFEKENFVCSAEEYEALGKAWGEHAAAEGEMGIKNVLYTQINGVKYFCCPGYVCMKQIDGIDVLANV